MEVSIHQKNPQYHPPTPPPPPFSQSKMSKKTSSESMKLARIQVLHGSFHVALVTENISFSNNHYKPNPCSGKKLCKGAKIHQHIHLLM